MQKLPFGAAAREAPKDPFVGRKTTRFVPLGTNIQVDKK